MRNMCYTENMKLNDQAGFTGKLRIKKVRNGKVVEVQEESNLVVSSSGHGRNLVIRQLANDTTYGIAIDSAKIGDDDTAPTDGDTDLGNAVLSGISVANQIVSNDNCTFKFFITDAQLADGTYDEFGMFIGSQMFSRAVFSNSYSKSSGEDTIVEYDITLNA